MSLSLDNPSTPPGGHMVVCGDDALAHRVAFELAARCGERVTVVLPSRQAGHGPQLAALARDQRLSVRLLEARRPDEEALLKAGIEQATALALTYGDDRTNIHAALSARRLNPGIRLVIRMFNRRLGEHVERLLGASSSRATITVLSDASTAAPELVAAAFDGSRNAISADGLLLHPANRPAGSPPRPADLCVLAITPGTSSAAPQLLPDDRTVDNARPLRGSIVLEAITENAGAEGTGPVGPAVVVPVHGRLRAAADGLVERLRLGTLFPRRVRRVLGGMAVLVALLTVANRLARGGPWLHSGYLTLLDVLTMSNPELDAPAGRQLLQLVGGIAGVLFAPVLLAALLDAMGAFRVAATTVRPSRLLSDHVVLVGLGKVGTRVLGELHSRRVRVVCVERDPQARGVALARSLKVPTLIADVTEPGVLEGAGIGRSRALLALTSHDSTNLEAVLAAREVKPSLRAVMRLFSDDFADAVYRALRESHPDALTRSRSVSSLSAPSFAAAMLGRHVLGVMPVGREVLLFTTVEVGDHPELVGRTVADAFRPGQWRVIARDTSSPAERRPSLSGSSVTSYGGGQVFVRPALDWHLNPGHELAPGDRVVLATTRAGLNMLLARDQRRLHGLPEGAGTS